MSDNPLDVTPERTAEIEARAKQLMQDAGGTGSMDDFRERADELIRMEHAGTPGQLPNPMVHDTTLHGAIVEEASIQENLGEFPGGSSVADEGEWRETPMTREQLRHGGDPTPGRGDAP